MEILNELFTNKLLGVAILSWFLAQLCKVIVVLWNEHRIDWSQLMASGGMPSSHTSFVMALSVGIGCTQGFDSTLFALSMTFSFIVMYDAANVRLEAGKQAALLNQLIDALQNPNIEFDKRLKEILGHTPLQVLMGAILGTTVALIFF